MHIEIFIFNIIYKSFYPHRMYNVFHRASASWDRIAANPPMKTRKNTIARIFPRIGILFVKRVRAIITNHITAIDIRRDFDQSENID